MQINKASKSWFVDLLEILYQQQETLLLIKDILIYLIKLMKKSVLCDVVIQGNRIQGNKIYRYKIQSLSLVCTACNLFALYVFCLTQNFQFESHQKEFYSRLNFCNS